MSIAAYWLKPKNSCADFQQNEQTIVCAYIGRPLNEKKLWMYTTWVNLKHTVLMKDSQKTYYRIPIISSLKTVTLNCGKISEE